MFAVRPLPSRKPYSSGSKTRKQISTNLIPQWTPFSVGRTYSGHHFQINVENAKNASISGRTIKNGAARTFMPWTYVNSRLDLCSFERSCISSEVSLALSSIIIFFLQLSELKRKQQNSTDQRTFLAHPHKSIENTDKHVIWYVFAEIRIGRHRPECVVADFAIHWTWSAVYKVNVARCRYVQKTEHHFPRQRSILSYFCKLMIVACFNKECAILASSGIGVVRTIHRKSTRLSSASFTLAWCFVKIFTMSFLIDMKRDKEKRNLRRGKHNKCKNIHIYIYITVWTMKRVEKKNRIIEGIMVIFVVVAVPYLDEIVCVSPHLAQMVALDGFHGWILLVWDYLHVHVLESLDLQLNLSGCGDGVFRWFELAPMVVAQSVVVASQVQERFPRWALVVCVRRSQSNSAFPQRSWYLDLFVLHVPRAKL